MSFLAEWLSDGPNVPQGLNPCDTWMARVSGGSAGSVPILPPGFQLSTATDLGGGNMVLTGIYQGPATTAPTAFVDEQGGPWWRVTAFQPAGNPSLTWSSGEQQCLPTPGFNPGAGGAGTATPAQPGTPIKAPAPAPPVKAPAPVGATASSSSSSSTPLWVGLGLAAAGLLAWALK